MSEVKRQAFSPETLKRLEEEIVAEVGVRPCAERGAATSEARGPFRYTNLWRQSKRETDSHSGWWRGCGTTLGQ